MKLIATIGLLSTLLTSCLSGHQLLSSSLPADRSASMTILGEHPRIRVRNDGPGRLTLHFRGAEEEVDATHVPAGGVTLQSLAGPVLLRLITTSEGRCDYTVTLWGCTGLDADLTPRTDG